MSTPPKLAKRSEKRGFYKKYLTEPNTSVPESTARSRRQETSIDNDDYEPGESSHETRTEHSESGIHEDCKRGIKPYAQSKDGTNIIKPCEKKQRNEARNDTKHFEDCEENKKKLKKDNDWTDSDDEWITHNLEEGEVHPQNDVRNNVVDRRLLYDGCPITSAESELLILSFAMRHGLTDIALEDLLEVINCHLPRPILPSRYLFLKNYRERYEAQKCFYCPKCLNLLIRHDIDHLRCENCNQNFERQILHTNQNYFMRLPLAQQFADIMNSHLFYDLRRISDSDSDLINGSVYKNLRERNLLGMHDITLQFNTDGVQVPKSTTSSLWPIYVTINELPFKLRNENAILCGIWYGPVKPDMDVYLKFFVDELNELHLNGYDCVTPDGDAINVKVHTIVSPVDSVARPLLQGLTQFNGEYGCSFCLHKGERIEVGDGNARVYKGLRRPPRTLLQHRRDAEEASRLQEPVNGVKCSSILLLLSVFNIISSFVPEYMHAVLLGVVKTMVNAFFDPKNRGKEWFLGDKIDDIDKKVQAIKPCIEITRTPRSLKERGHWKAAEWKHFLLYYSLTCFHNFLPARYLKHWLLLVSSIYFLLREKLDPAEIEKANKALRLFVEKTETLYGAEFCRFNVHLLLHFVDSVKRFGALWACSAFNFESYNHVIVNLIKSKSNAVPEQICKLYYRSRIIERKSAVVFTYDNCDVNAKRSFLKMSQGFRVQRCIEFGPHLRLFGQALQVDLELRIKLSIENLLGVRILNDAIKYKRFIHKHMLLHSSDYERLTKRNNSFIQVDDGRFIEILGFYVAKHLEVNENYNVIVGKICEPLQESIVNYYSPQFSVSSNDIASLFSLTNNVVSVLPSMIAKKCVKVDFSETIASIIPLANSVERD